VHVKISYHIALNQSRSRQVWTLTTGLKIKAKTSTLALETKTVHLGLQIKISSLIQYFQEEQ